jgi:pyridoxine 5'-phosphate synthase PdxJ
MTYLTRHAREQIDARQVCTQAEVMREVTRKAREIRRHWQEREVKVIVKTMKAKVILEGDSNGEVVVACVDPYDLGIKTVMLTRQAQIERKSKYEVYI